MGDWWVGKKHSSEARKKMSSFARGRILSLETRQKMSDAHKGKVQSETWIRNRALALVGHKVSQVTRMKISQSKRGKTTSEETKKKLSEAGRRRVQSEETRLKIATAHRGRVRQTFSVEWRRNMADSHKGMRVTDAAKEKIREKLLARMNYSWKPTSIERIIMKQLQTGGINFEFQKRVGNRVFDFYLPQTNVLIECDGTFWHSRERQKLIDAEKNVLAESRGFKLVRIPESEIMKQDFDVERWLHV